MIKPQIRKHYFKDEFVIIAPGRAQRSYMVTRTTETAESCPFCPKNFMAEKTITYQDNNPNGDWEIISIFNKFPVVSIDNRDAFGQAEVIIETREHRLNINDFSVGHIVRVFNAYIDRFNSLKNIDGVKHVIVFKNEGGKAGASLAHTHSQVIAMPFLPPRVESEARAYNKYRIERATCPYCDVIMNETGKPRVIWEDDNVFVLAPYASNAPFNAWLLPKRHVRLMSELTHSEKESFATALRMVLSKLDEYGMSYNYFIENAVNQEDYHMHIKLEPRPNVWGGLELGTGVIINPVSPEYAAKVYRG